jgi:pimeloyl-ACP methyl ester carboxylesterase
MTKLSSLVPSLLILARCMPPSWGAAALLHPSRSALTKPPPLPAENVEFVGDGVTLKGWLFRAKGERRGAIVYLHGSADNRALVAGVAKRHVPRGYDVLAYDSRAHGESTGDACTYGYCEKRDMAKAIDFLQVPGPGILGVSLGAAVALQAAADDARITRPRCTRQPRKTASAPKRMPWRPVTRRPLFVTPATARAGGRRWNRPCPPRCRPRRRHRLSESSSPPLLAGQQRQHHRHLLHQRDRHLRPQMIDSGRQRLKCVSSARTPRARAGQGRVRHTGSLQSPRCPPRRFRPSPPAARRRWPS